MSLPYFFLTLDTTEPKINLYAPNYTNRLTSQEIRIESSEPLADYQDIYIIDSKKNRHNLVFSKVSATEFVGELRFSGFPYGIATIFAQVKDEVGNLSRLSMFNINVLPVYDTYEFGLKLEESVTVISTFSWEALKKPPHGSNVITGTREQTIDLVTSEANMTAGQLFFKLSDTTTTSVNKGDKPLTGVNIYDSEE